MKKLSKLSLLGEMDLLSKAELRQLVGAEYTRCHGSSKDKCTGTCPSPGDSCVWSQTNKCHCETLMGYSGYSYY